MSPKNKVKKNDLKNTLFIIIVLLFSLTEGVAQSKFQKIFMNADSLGPHMAIRCENMITLKDTSYSVYGIQESFKRFELYSKINVQTMCLGTKMAEFETAIGRYEIAIASNYNDSLGTLMVDSIQQEWKNLSKKLQDYFSLSNGEYLLYRETKNYLKDPSIFMNFSGRYIKITFRGYASKVGLGGLSQFMNQLCYFSFGDAYIEPGTRPTKLTKNYFILYKEKSPQN